MSSWFTKNLGDAMFASEALGQIAADFARFHEQDGRPQAMALFYRHESGRLHCQVKLYLSPAAAAFADQIGASPCERPSAEGLDLLVGDERCRPILFPEVDTGMGG